MHIYNVMTSWTIEEYNNWIEQGRPINFDVVKLDISGSNITSLDGIENLVHLTTLYCYSNELRSLNGIENLVNLTTLHCSHNQLTSLSGIQNLVNLTTLFCSDNQLTSLNGIENLVHLTNLYYENNPINHIPPNLVRRLNAIQNGQNVYGDSQNVHNHNIQECIKKSINNILQFEPIIKNLNQCILADPILTNQSKEILIEYIENKEIFCALNLTFEELAIYVFSRIEINEHKDEIKRVLNTEMHDSICKCFPQLISFFIKKKYCCVMHVFNYFFIKSN